MADPAVRCRGHRFIVLLTGLIEQGGSRRGALMLILNVWHPDILDFINAKKEAGKITNANIFGRHHG